ncbi:hypothetical protein SNE40_019668 [Patella caerulea]|uniref:RING-type domain-containing protein n=1 Tax=Patella caerulea TaxID=87958 RepID=A0AAN8J7W5_PATCE
MMTVDSSYVAPFTSATVFPEQSPDELMAYETWRLKSFDEWPREAYDKARPMALAKDGFYYTGTEDIVKCFSCGVQKGQWAFRSKPNVEHQRLNPECLHLLGQDTRNISVYLPDPETRQTILTNLHERYCSGDSSHSNSISQSETISFRTNSNMDRPNNISSQNTVMSQPSLLLQLNTSSSFNSDVINRSDSTGRRPVTQLSTPLREDKVILLSEMARLQTFKNSWPHCSPSPNDLAKAGFSFTGSPDRVQCVFCNGILKNWQDVDIPMIEHRKHFPNCPFVCGHQVGNIPIDVRSHFSTSYNERLDATHSHGTGATNQFTPVSGIHTERPRHPNYATEASRIASYTTWPSGLSQTPQQLAKAGFFYAGFDDSVKCFYCDGGLRTWERGDDPWEEHAKWFSRCPYVLQVRGEAFVQQFHNHNNPSQNTASGDNSDDLSTIDRNVSARIDLPVVQNVLKMGVPRDVVINVIETRLQQTGDDFPSVEMLLNAIYDANETTTSKSPTPPPQDEQKNADVNKELPNRNDEEISGESNADHESLILENQRLKEQRTCKICMDEEANIVLLPCGHLVSCASCAPALRKCPICRANIKGTVRTYLS